MLITPIQSRAARALLDISREKLAELAGVSATTIKRFEMQIHPPPQPHMRRRIATALEAAGVEFVDDGVVLRPSSKDLA